MATAFGPEGCAILHMLSEIDPGVSGSSTWTPATSSPRPWSFASGSLAAMGSRSSTSGLTVPVAEYEAGNGGPIYGTDPDRCCHDRKIVPLRRAVEGYDAWISAIRADQSTHRARADVVGWDAKFGLVKVNPLLRVDQARRLGLRRGQRGPVQPAPRPGLSVDRLLALHPVGQGRGDDERAGRWAGQAKTECGLHSLDSSQL